jgi:hypothetical protein
MTEKEKQEFFDFERYAQQILDGYYESKNHTVDRTTACKLYDCIMDGVDKVEEKIRQEEHNDILVEVIQDMVTYSPGWFYETRCDYLHYVFMNDTKISRFLRIDWNKFKGWCLSKYFIDNKHPYSVISPKGWGVTVNFSIPIKDIPKYLYYDERPRDF